MPIEYIFPCRLPDRCNYTILSAAAKMSATAVILMNVVITVIGVVLALFVNLRYGKLLARTEK